MVNPSGSFAYPTNYISVKLYLFFSCYPKGNTVEAIQIRETSDLYLTLEELIKNKNLYIDFTIISLMTKAIAIARVPFNKIERMKPNNRFGTTQLLKTYKLKYPKSTFINYKENSFYDMTVDNCAKSNFVFSESIIYLFI